MQRQPHIPLEVADMRHRPLMAVVVVVVTLGVVAVADTLVAASTGRSTGS